MTKKAEIFERSVMIFSVIPSLKYSCFGSSLMFTKGSTAMDGLSGKGYAIFSIEAGSIRLDCWIYKYHPVNPPAPISSIRAMAKAIPLLVFLFSPITLPTASGSVRILYTRTGSVMFLTLCSPRYS